MDKKHETPQRNLRRFALWGDLEKERFVLRGGTLRFIFSERFVLRIIYTAQTPTVTMPATSSVENLADGLHYSPAIEIRNARFVDDNQDNVISRGELCKIIFEVMNRGKEVLYDVQPTVIEATGNKHIYISPGVHVEKIMPGAGIRYTALVKADNRLKNGKAKFCVSVVQGTKSISKVSEFNIPTRK